MDKKRVLSLEDERQTISSIVDELRNAGVYVAESETVDGAEHLIANEKFDLLLVDLRVGRLDANGKLHEGHLDEGQLFIERVKRGEHGTFNLTTPFVMLTAFSYEVQYDTLLGLPGYSGVVPKARSALRDLAARLSKPCPWLSSLLPNEDFDYVVEDLVIFEGFDEGGFYSVTVPSWPGRVPVRVEIRELPQDVSQELDYGERPVFVWASVNIAAERPEFVRPHSMRVSSYSDEQLESAIAAQPRTLGEEKR